MQTFPNSSYLKIGFVFLTFLTFKFSYAQDRVYYKNVSSERNVESDINAVDGNLSTSAILKANSGLAFGLGKYTGSIELEPDLEIPSNKTTYLKIATEENLLEPLLSGSVADVTSKVLGSTLIGNQEFTIAALDDGVTVLEGSSNNLADFAGEELKVLVNANKEFLIAINPNSAYNKIKITNSTGSLLGLNTERSLEVYEAYYLDGENSCSPEIYTSWSGNGLTLDLFNLSNAKASNLDFAIDGNDETYSEIGLGLLGALGSIEQQFYFTTPVQTAEEIVLKFQLDPVLLGLGFLNNIELILKDGETVGKTFSLSNKVSTELLNNLQNGEIVEVRIKPTKAVDNLVIKLNSLLNISIDQNIRIVEVSRVLSPPTINGSSNNLSICEGNNASLSANSEPNNTINWYDAPKDGNLLASTASGELFTTDILTSDTTYYAEAQSEICFNTSKRVAVNVEVIPLPTATDIVVINNISALCSNESNVTLNPSSAISKSFNWYFDSEMNTEITDGLIQDNFGYAISDNGELTITGLTEANSPYTYYVNVAEPLLGCAIPAGNLKEVKVEIISSDFSASVLPDFTINNTSLSSHVNANGTLEITGIIQGDAQQGDAISLIVNNTTYTGNIASDNSFGILVDGEALVDDKDYTINVLIESANESCAVTDTIPIGLDAISVLEEVQTFCEADNPTLLDLSINGSNFEIFSSLLGGVALDVNSPLVNGETYYIGILGLPISIFPRLAITVKFNKVPQATTDAVVQVFCATDAPVVADIIVDGDSLLFYDNVIDGNLLSLTDALVDGTSYFVSNTVSGCEGLERLEIQVNIIDVLPPDINEVLQVFCASDNPTLGDINTNGETVLFFDAEIGGNQLLASDLLVDGGIYYAVNVSLGCVSITRTAITINLIDVPPPTTNNTNQSFCATENPTIQELQVNEEGVVWYDAESDGNQLDNSMQLIDGETYYAAKRENTCESRERLAILVQIINVPPPTTDNADQSFCEAENPIIQDLQVNEAVVIWYDALTDGNQLNDNTPLTDGTTYYASNLEGGCESSERLSVTVVFSSNTQATIDGEFEEACLNDTETYTTQSAMENYQWTVTGGDIVDGGTSTDDFVSINWNRIENTNLSLSYSGGCGISSTEVIDVNVVNCVLSAEFTLQIFNEFTPNNDGFNDFFRVEGITEFNNTVEVYNRYGRMVYKAINYQNDWDGIANVNNALNQGDHLPSGTYYYVIQIPELDRNMSGWLQLAR